MTTMWRCATGSASRRATLSRIVTASLSAGTRNSHVKASAPSSGASGACSRLRSALTNSRVVQAIIITITTKATMKRTRQTVGMPSNGSATAVHAYSATSCMAGSTVSSSSGSSQAS